MGQKKNIIVSALNLFSIGIYPSKILNIFSILIHFRPIRIRPSIKVILISLIVFELFHLCYVLYPSVEALKLTSFVAFVLICSKLKINHSYFKAISVILLIFFFIATIKGDLFNPVSGALNGIVGNSQGVMLIILPIFVYWLLDNHSYGRIFWIVLFGLCLYYSQSRTGIIVVALLTVVYLLRNRRVMSLFFLAVFILINQAVLIDFFAKGVQANELTLLSLNSRSRLISESISDFITSNWFGVGFGFQPGHPDYDPLNNYIMSMPSERGSAYFAMLAELGLLGTVLVCFLLWLILPRDKKYFRYAILLSLLAESSLFSLFYLGVFQSTLLFAKYE